MDLRSEIQTALAGFPNHPKQILDIYSILCSGKDRPYVELCNLFDQETNHGSDMKAYDTLLKKAVDSLAATFRKRAASGLQSGRGFVLPDAKEQVHEKTDLQLVTWLVIQDSKTDGRETVFLYLGRVKTTINIPEHLYKCAKIRAVETGQTLKQIVLTSLEYQLNSPPSTNTPTSYWANRKLTPDFARLQAKGAFRPRPSDRDIASLISEDGEDRPL